MSGSRNMKQQEMGQPLNILVVGLGVIGTVYGYLFQKAGYHVEHYIRPDSPKRTISELGVEMLDGRGCSKGKAMSDTYRVQSAQRKVYDFIFVSVPSGNIADVVSTLKQEQFVGTVLLCCGIWETRQSLDLIMQGYPYILGYPVAGGNLADGTLNCCVFGHFMIEREECCRIPNRSHLTRLFADCQIRFEQPYDMLEWTWIHMAINAGVVSVAGRYGGIHDTAKSAEALMDSTRMLSDAIRAIRETVGIVAARGVQLKQYRNELLAYRLPTFLSAPLMKRMFARNLLTRRIMTLHGNRADLFFVCRSLYECGKQNNIPAPLFYSCYEAIVG